MGETDDPIIQELINKSTAGDTEPKLPCRNCHFLFTYPQLHKVQGYRFCDVCYDKMKEIGQIVRDWRKKDGSEAMLWQGDPFNKDKTKFDPYPHMMPKGGRRDLWD